MAEKDDRNFLWNTIMCNTHVFGPPSQGLLEAVHKCRQINAVIKKHQVEIAKCYKEYSAISNQFIAEVESSYKDYRKSTKRKVVKKSESTESAALKSLLKKMTPEQVQVFTKSLVGGTEEWTELLRSVL